MTWSESLPALPPILSPPTTMCHCRRRLGSSNCCLLRPCVLPPGRVQPRTVPPQGRVAGWRWRRVACRKSWPSKRHDGGSARATTRPNTFVCERGTPFWGCWTERSVTWSPWTVRGPVQGSGMGPHWRIFPLEESHHSPQRTLQNCKMKGASYIFFRLALPPPLLVSAVHREKERGDREKEMLHRIHSLLSCHQCWRNFQHQKKECLPPPPGSSYSK